MMKNPLVRYLVVGFVTVLLCLFSNGLFTASAQNNPNPFSSTGGFKNFLNIPLNQQVVGNCTSKLKNEFLQTNGTPLNCVIGSKITADKLLSVGNFSSLKLLETSQEKIANFNGIDLKQVNVSQLQKFYSLVTPNKLLLPQFNNVYKNLPLANSPLLREALVQFTKEQYAASKFGNLQKLSKLIANSGGNITFPAGGSVNLDRFRQQISNLSLGQLVNALPDFANRSVTKNLSSAVQQAISAKGAIPGIESSPLGMIPGSENVPVADYKSIGLNQMSVAQMPQSLTPAFGMQVGRFDLTLGSDENPSPKKGRQISGGYPGSSFRKQDCAGKCAFAEISAPGTKYHGAIWVEADGDIAKQKNWVPDGYGPIACAIPPFCKGPPGNNPFGPDFRFVFTNINPKKGTADVGITTRVCDMFRLNCSPSIFPIPSGFPIGKIKEGDPLFFIVPENYGT
jgi:hypothetical protein